MSAECEADALFSEAERLARGKTGHAAQAKPGFIRLADGRWRSAELHARILDLYGRADQLFPANGLALYRLALEALGAGDFEGADARQRQLAERGSSYAGPYLPIWIALARGDKASAKRHLDALNAENKRLGRPRNSLRDFEL
jgi:hypothetical protein